MGGVLVPPNTKPIFPLTPNLGGFARLTTANTATDGTGTVAILFTAGANGARLDKVLCLAGGSNVATAIRLFINNGSSNATATNNSLLLDRPLPATSAANADAIGPDIELPCDISLPAGFRIMACIGTTVAAGWHLTPIGGDY